MPLRGIATLVVALSAALQAVSQGSNVTCSSQYAWMTNSRGQNPCVVSAYLQGACLKDPTQAYFFPLDTGFYYWSPWKDDETPCTCNTVYFSTLAACMACQNEESFEDSTPWSTWTTNCTTPIVGRWPTQVPAGTAIPSWAFLDVVRSDRFNVTLAKNMAAYDLPDTTMLSSTATPTSTFTTVTSQTTQTAPMTSSAKKINPGVITGVAVGALVLGGTLIGAIIFCCMRRRRGVALGQASSALVGHASSEKNSSSQTRDPLLNWVQYDPKSSTTLPGSAAHTPMDARFHGLPEI